MRILLHCVCCLRPGSLAGPASPAWWSAARRSGAGNAHPERNLLSDTTRTDLVFIGAPGTGFSGPVGKATIKNFAGTDQDVQAFNRFIHRYLSVNKRWNSPKFLFGESYGTTRSAALVDSLEGDGMSFNGVVLLSTVLNYFNQTPGMDNQFIGNLPTYAATAWYYKKVPHKGSGEKEFLHEVRAFARGEYAESLAQGHNLPQAKFDAVAAKVASYTGLSVIYVKEANLRVSPTRFRKELMRGERLILGRYDTRFEGTDTDAAGEIPGYDPSSTGITGAYVSAFHDYLDRDLHYTSKETYYPRGPGINQAWDHTHRPPGAAGGAGGQAPPLRDVYVAGDLADAMRKNPQLKVFSANGLFDLATPFFITETDLAHMNLEHKLAGNIEFGYYPAGHMVYLNVDALKQMKNDLSAWYAKVLGGAKSAGVTSE